ncbi:MAG: peroxidase [Chloroflexi bacterium]|nr:peroxidase [Chloroflexota bacterium]
MLKHKVIGITAACLLTGGSVSPSLAQTAPASPNVAQPTASQNHVKLLQEFRPIGATDNNKSRPELNPTPGSPELALAPLNFAPGTNDGLVDGPNPRTISNVISGGTGAQGQNAATVDPGASAWLYVFGQFVDHDLDLESNSPSGTPINITVPVGDPVFTTGGSIAMTRDVRDPKTNTIVNTTAGYLDLSQLYGSTTDVANSLRNTDGTLTSANNGQTLPIVSNNFVTGDPRVMENPELTAVTTLFMREHNFWVATLHAQNPSWTGDQLYNMAKAITTAEYENIVFNEYLPILLGSVPAYGGYDPKVNTQVSQEFAEAAFRMGHSQVSDQQEGLNNNGVQVFNESLGQAFFNTPALDISPTPDPGVPAFHDGIDALLRSLSVDNSQATDVYAMAGLRNLLFAPLAGGNVDQIDLIAIDIQRERDAGLGTLNQTRKALGLPPHTSFSDLTSDTVLQQDLKTTYGSIDNVDLFIGGLAEAHVNNGRLGQTFQAIIGTQFQNLRTGDRFWWQNQQFDPHTASTISSTTLATILRRDTDSTNVPDHVFVPTPAAARVRPAAATVATSTTTPINTQGRPFIFP